MVAGEVGGVPAERSRRKRDQTVVFSVAFRGSHQPTEFPFRIRLRAIRGLTLWRTVMKDHTRERLQGGTGQRRRLQGAVHLRTLRARLVVREVHEHALERRHASFFGRHHQRCGTDGQPLTRLLTSHRSPTPPFPPPRQCACSTARARRLFAGARPGVTRQHTQELLKCTPRTHSRSHPGPTRHHTQDPPESTPRAPAVD